MKRLYLAVLALLLWNNAMAADIEEPQWTLVDTVDEVELREYAPTVRAVTQLDHAGQTSSGFQRLAGFIFGGNDTGQKIAMTAPVEETLHTDAPVMAFTMPAEYAMEDLPNPEDNSVTLQAMPGRTMAAIRALPQLFIVAIEGAAMAGGLGTVLGPLVGTVVQPMFEAPW